MTEFSDSRLWALREGHSFTWAISDGGDLASMRAAIKHGQTLTMSPVTDPRELQIRDIVLVKWHKGHMMHLIQEIRGNQFLIANSAGKINGWVSGNDIIGRVTKIIDPELRPGVL